MQRGVLAVLALLATGIASADPAFHLAGGAGISYGGDTLDTLTYTSGDSTDIKAGGLFYLNAGPVIEFTGSPISLQVLLGYQVDNATATNADAKFDRSTLDATLLYHTGNHYLGAGIVNHYSPTYERSAFYNSDTGQYYAAVTENFADANGIALEYQFRQPHSHVGFSLRAVSISYSAESVTVGGVKYSAAKKDVDGSFISAGFYVYL
jgi:hypothetical protein